MNGAELRKLRADAGLKAGQLAKLLGLSPSTLSRYERDRKPIPDVVTLAVRYICEKRALNPASSPAERLLEALREAVIHVQTQSRQNG